MCVPLVKRCSRYCTSYISIIYVYLYMLQLIPFCKDFIWAMAILIFFVKDGPSCGWPTSPSEKSRSHGAMLGTNVRSSLNHETFEVY